VIVDLLASAALILWTWQISRAFCRVDLALRAGLAFRESAFLLREGRA
jgi:hypothetical protein